MRVTVKDVAKEAKVSPATVSRVFNKNANISEETKENVLAVAAKLGYKPRRYKSQNQAEGIDKRRNIAVVFNNRLSSLIEDPFYGQVISGIEEEVSQNNYNLFFRSVTGDLKSETEKVESLLIDEKLAGVIATGYEIDEVLVKRIQESKVPLVLVDSNLHDENVDMILNDNTTGARVATNHLINLGHHRIGFIGGPLSHRSLDERYIGYKQALRNAGIRKDDQYIAFCEPKFDADDGYQVALAMLKSCKELPTAIFAANDMLAIGVIRAIYELNYDVPRDISVIGFDDIQTAQHTMPPLTTVRIQKREMGIMAAKRILGLIEDKDAKPVKVIVSVDLVERDSVSVPKS